MLRVLFIGDIVGKQGRNALIKHLPFLKEKYNYDILIINGENAAHGKGLTEKIYNQFVSLGVDCVTLGNHAFSKKMIFDFIDKSDRLIRPYNMEPTEIGSSVKILEYQNYKIGIFNLYGTIFMENATTDPFEAFNILKEKYPCDIKIVDLHAEATSEKYAFMQYFKDEVQMVVGTHTHIPTADEDLFNKCAFICDVGMTGPYDSVLGRDTEEVLQNLVYKNKTRYTISENEAVLNAVVVDIDCENQRAVSIERVQIRPEKKA